MEVNIIKPPKNAPITLTGDVYDRYKDVSEDDPTSWINLEPLRGDEPENELMECAGEKLVIVRIPFNRGDVALYQRLDMYGRYAIAGKHTNYGYSGYFKASVFDSKKWRAFKIWNIAPEGDRHYANQSELVKVRQRLTRIIEALSGACLIWGHRAYELPTLGKNNP